MAAGLPAVAFADVSGVEDLVASGETGLLVPSAQASSENLFADALAQLMRSPELREQMGKAAKNRVDIFRPEIVFGQWDDVIATTNCHQ
jgi:glycosyltransferase involved in cell wall biosynthesis